MTTLEIISLVLEPVLLAVIIILYIKFHNARKDAIMFWQESETDKQDIAALQKANDDFKTAHEAQEQTIQQLQLNAAKRERYINEVIQPSIFHKREKFLELDDIGYEMFAIVDIVTKYPQCIHIIPVNLWNQITEELTKQEAYHMLEDMHRYRRTNPMKFTPRPFGEVFWRAPLWSLPGQI